MGREERNCEGLGTNLVAQLLVHGFVFVRAELLLEEGEEDRDNDTGLEGLSEDDEEDGDRKDLNHLGSGVLLWFDLASWILGNLFNKAPRKS